jgi:hypothetical protein
LDGADLSRDLAILLKQRKDLTYFIRRELPAKPTVIAAE